MSATRRILLTTVHGEIHHMQERIDDELVSMEESEIQTFLSLLSDANNYLETL